MAITIIYKPIDLSNQKIVEDMGCCILLEENHIRYKLNFYADEPIKDDDEKLGTEQIENYFEVVLLKKHITGVEKTLTLEKLWKITIVVLDLNPPKFYFKNEMDADKLMQTILDYIIS